MITRKKGINDATINLRIPSLLKKQFIEVCEKQNLRYQKVIKQLIMDYANTPIKDLEEHRREQYLKTQRLL